MPTLSHYALLQITRSLIQHELGADIGNDLPRLLVKCIAPVTSFLEIAFVVTNGYDGRSEGDDVSVQLRNKWLNSLDASEKCLIRDLQTIDENRDAALSLNGHVTKAMASIAKDIHFDADLPSRNLMLQAWPEELQWNFWLARFLAVNPRVMRSPSAASLVGELFVWCLTNTEESIMNSQTDPGNVRRAQALTKTKTLRPMINQWRRLAVAFALSELDDDGRPPKDFAGRWLANLKSKIQSSMIGPEHRALLKFAKEDLGLILAEENVVEEILEHLLLETRIRALKLDRLIKLLKQLRIHKYEGKSVRSLPANFSKRELVENVLIPRLKDFRKVPQ